MTKADPKVPDVQTHPVPVEIMGPAGETISGVAEVTTLSSQQAFWKGGKRSAKLIGVVMLVLLPFGFLEPFLFMVWGSAALGILVLVVGPYLHFRFWSETESFRSVNITCPHCQAPGPLNPYLSTRFETEITVLCPSCGQTSRARQAR